MKGFLKKNTSENNSVENNKIVKLSQLTLHKLNWLEYIAIGVSCWFLFYPKPYTLVFTILILIPLIGIIINGLHKPSISSLVEITIDNKKELKYDVADFIDIAAWAILLRIVKDYNFENYRSLIFPGILSISIITIILFFTHKKIEESNRNKLWIYTSIIFNISIYSLATTYGINCVYDSSKPKIFETKITDKTITTRKSKKSYYIEIAPWGEHFEKEEILVSKSEYEEYNIGENVEIDLKEGFLYIPWFYVEKKYSKY